MSLLGTVWNKVLGKFINVYLAEGGSGFMRLSNAVDQTTKDLALTRLKAVFEAGKLFNDIDMVKMEKITITYVVGSSLGSSLSFEFPVVDLRQELDPPQSR